MIIGLLVGFFVGTLFGTVLMACLCVNKRKQMCFCPSCGTRMLAEE